MKRMILFASLLLVPLGLFMATWQAFSYYQLHLEVENLEKAQQTLLDSNRRLVAEYAFATSPGTIEKRASQELGMIWPGQDRIISLKIKPSGSRQ